MKKFILGFMCCLILCTITYVIAESINSNEVLYDNSNSSSSATDVQGALDEVFNIVDSVGSGYSLVAHNPSGLSTELVAGLYRYQGVQDDNNHVDNYICFGTTNKSTCVGDTDKYMYRIIGISESGQMKLLKKEALNTAYQWHSTNNSIWPNSDLYAGLNGSYFLTNITYIPDSTWSNRIIETDWHYYTSTNYSSSTITERELAAPTVNAKIGLIYLHDFANSLTPPDYSSNSWMHLLKNDSNPPSRYYEFTISSYNNKIAYKIYENGSMDYYTGRDKTSTFSVRPVFFLRSSEIIASGSGTITDPYVLGETS